MFKLIIFHPGIGLKQKLYLIYKYCICYYYHLAMYFIEYVIRLYLNYLNDISIKLENYNRQKSWSKNTGKDILKDLNVTYKDMKKLRKAGLRGAKVGTKLRKMLKPSRLAKKKLKLHGIIFKADDKVKSQYLNNLEKRLQKEKDQLYQHLIDNPLGFKQANEILKIAGILSRRGIYLNDLFNKEFNPRLYKNSWFFHHYYRDK